MSFIETMQTSYKTVIKEEWKNLPLQLSDIKDVVFPMTTTNDAAMHLAVYSGEEEPMRGFLAVLTEKNVEVVYWKNDSGNTPLHEAASVGNLAAAKLLVEYNNQNGFGETPLYRAARCGHLNIVQYFIEECEDFYARAPLNWSMAINK